MTRQPTPDIMADLLGPVHDEAKLVRTQLRYDYELIPAEQRGQVQAAAVEIVQAGRRAQDDLMKIGQRLIEVKELLEHGQFQEWCETEFQMTARTARNMMNVAKVFGDKTETVSVLSDSAMYLLAAPSTSEEARVEVIAQAQATGKTPTKAEVQETIKKHQPPAQTYLEVWKLEAQANTLAKEWDMDPGMMREGARQQLGSYWGELTHRVNQGGQYRARDLKQAINNVASRMEAKAAGTNQPASDPSKTQAGVYTAGTNNPWTGDPIVILPTIGEPTIEIIPAADKAARQAAEPVPVAEVIDAELFEAAERASITNCKAGEMRKPFQWNGAYWVSTGGVYGGADSAFASRECVRVHPTGEPIAPGVRIGCYRDSAFRPGTMLLHNFSEWRIGEQWLVVKRKGRQPADEPDREERAVAKADAAFGLAQPQTRNERIDALLHVFQSAVDALPELGELTGHYMAGTAALRELNKVMQVLRDNKIGGFKANE